MRQYKDKCVKFDECNAPLCPMDTESIEHGTWFPEEEICTLQAVNQEAWIRRQRKYARRAKEGCYTHKMLCHNTTIGRGTSGVLPENLLEDGVEKWFNRHPVIKEMTEEERIILRDRFSKAMGRSNNDSA